MTFTDLQHPESTLYDLSDRAERLLGELRRFQELLSEHGKQHEVELRAFRRGVQSEAKSLQTIRKRQAKLATEALNDGEPGADDHLDCMHALKSSNLPFYEMLWNTAKQCRRIAGLGRRVCSDLRTKQPSKTELAPKEIQNSATVDIIAEDGLMWIKVSTINNRRLLFEMAKQGWESYGDYSSDEDVISGLGPVSARGDTLNKQLDLVKTAETIMEASRSHRVLFKHPQVQFVLPNVQAGSHEDIDAFLCHLKATGVNVVCGTALESSSAINTKNMGLDAGVLQTLLPSSTSSGLQLTSTLNIDCTILLALISDISHVVQGELPPHPENRSGTYHKAILRQIESEKDSPLLPKEVYPLLTGKALHTTSFAAERMLKIVNTMGTEQEKKRAEIFLGQGPMANKSAHQIREELRNHSCHIVPETLILPITTVNFEDLSTDSSPYPQSQALSMIDNNHGEPSSSQMSPLDMLIARELTQKITLSKINASVFFYGWSRDIVTITSNKVVAASMIKAVDELLDEYEFHQEQGISKSLSVSQSDSSPMIDRDEKGTVANWENIGDFESRSDAMRNFVGPKIYICETARSLIGKEKQAQPE